MTENEFILEDRLAKIRSMNEQYDLEHNAYISYSGGKDSTVLSHIIDKALPGNKIPRVFLNTGIEYQLIVAFVLRERGRDNRIVVVEPTQDIRTILNNFGYPFKSKEHSLYVSVFQNSGITKTVDRYLHRKEARYRCPEKLQYQFTEDFQLKVSNKCCYKLKKDVADRWSKEHHRNITITGMRHGEGGLRQTIKGCAVFSGDTLKKFHPLQPCSEDFIDWFIVTQNIQLCELYYEPYNFKRTGCKGCPFNSKLNEALATLREKLPAEAKQCELIWKPVYDEYRRIGYRLKENKCSSVKEKNHTT